jgi:hypothetical protein
MSQPASVALATARTFLNDDAIQNWTDAALIPKLQRAHIELQLALKKAAAPVMKDTYIETISANATVFSTQPTNIIAPIQLWEKAPSDPVNLYALMTEFDPLPNVSPTATMIYWAWVKEVVTFIGSTASRQIKMLYWRALPLPATGTDPIGFIDGELYLAPQTAAYAYGSTGDLTTMASLTQLATASLSDVILSNRGRAPQIAGGSQKP